MVPILLRHMHNNIQTGLLLYFSGRKYFTLLQKRNETKRTSSLISAGNIITARRYVMALCLCVRPSVRLSQVKVLSQRRNLSSGIN